MNLWVILINYIRKLYYVHMNILILKITRILAQIYVISPKRPQNNT